MPWWKPAVLNSIRNRERTRGDAFTWEQSMSTLGANLRIGFALDTGLATGSETDSDFVTWVEWRFLPVSIDGDSLRFELQPEDGSHLLPDSNCAQRLVRQEELRASYAPILYGLRMITLAQSRLARTATLCALYCAQGIPWGFVTITLLAYIAEQGGDLDQMAKITALATLPWSFKMIWGVLIDRFTLRSMGRRRPWVLLAQLGVGASALSMILLDDLSADVETLAKMVFVHNCFVSLQDVASDALAVDILDDQERGRVNGLMWASSFVGTAIGGAGLGTVLARFGLQAAFAVEVVVLFGIALFPLLIREREGERLLPWTAGEAQGLVEGEGTTSLLQIMRNLWKAFSSRGALIGAVFAAISTLVVGMMVALNPFFFTGELGWTQVKYSQVMGGGEGVAGISGALLGGFLVDRLGVRTIYVVAGLIIAAFCLALGFSEALRNSEAFCVAYLLGVVFLTSAQTVAGFSLFMRLCSAVVAGTQFTLFMAISNFGRVGAAQLVGALQEHGVSVIFSAMGASMLVSILILFAIPQSKKDYSSSG
ncbi:MAG: PAT family beta-lactamase induction signal transducer AmpG [Planctomycetota bacterium]